MGSCIDMGPSRTRLARPAPQIIKSARAEAQLTQSAAAALVHVSVRAWQKWEQGEREMPMSTLHLFLLRANLADRAKSLGLPFDSPTIDTRDLANSPAVTEREIDVAHEIYTAAQRAPGEGMIDAVDRIVTLLAGYRASL